MREISYKAVLHSESLNRYFVSDALRVDTGLACLFGFENQLEEQFNDLILCSEKFVKEIKEDWWMHDWVHEGNIEYTGLKDKNGVEIYEGDIVINIFDDQNYEVRFKNGTYIIYSQEQFIYPNDLHHHIKENDVEVIGNIYENPELLGDAHEPL